MQSLLANVPPHAWLLTHRPLWALAEGDGVPKGATSNATEEAAMRGLVPPTLDMVLSGHIHDFTAYEFGPDRPAQLLAGQGGLANDAIAWSATVYSIADQVLARCSLHGRDVDCDPHTP